MRIVVVSKAIEQYLPFLNFFWEKYPQSEFWLVGERPLPGFDAQLFNHVDSLNFEQSRNSGLLVSFFFGKVIPQSLLSQFDQAVNFHMSLLPNYAGPHSLNWQLINGEKMSGVTLHHMTEKVDGGPIVRQVAFSISSSWDANDLLSEGVKQSIRLAGEVDFGNVDPGIDQVTLDSGDFFVCKRRKREDGEILPGSTAIKIYNMSRALVEPWPGIFFSVMGHKFHCSRALSLAECFLIERLLSD